MKILHIENGRFFYGGPQQVLYLCSGLNDHGIENEWLDARELIKTDEVYRSASLTQ